MRDLYSLAYLGPFKEAGTLVGTSKVYTLDGRLEPERSAKTRSAFMVAPIARQAAASTTRRSSRWRCWPACRDTGTSRPGETTPINIAGLDGFELKAEALDADDDVPVQLYQAMLVGKDGGYFRLIGIATRCGQGRLPAEFAKIARSFTLLP